MYVEPYESAPHGAGVPVQPVHICTVSPEHLESAGDAVYWVLGHSRAQADVPELGEVVAVGREFGLEVTPVGSVPPELQNEARPLFANQPMHYLWWRVAAPSDSAGRHLAWLLYVALHMKSVMRKRMHVMHLCAAIEGRPRAREYWVNRDFRA